MADDVRAMLLTGFAGGLWRSEIVGLDRGRDESVDGLEWVEIDNGGMIARLRGQLTRAPGL